MNSVDKKIQDKLYELKNYLDNKTMSDQFENIKLEFLNNLDSIIKNISKSIHDARYDNQDRPWFSQSDNAFIDRIEHNIQRLINSDEELKTALAEMEYDKLTTSFEHTYQSIFESDLDPNKYLGNIIDSLETVFDNYRIQLLKEMLDKPEINADSVFAIDIIINSLNRLQEKITWYPDTLNEYLSGKSKRSIIAVFDKTLSQIKEDPASIVAWVIIHDQPKFMEAYSEITLNMLINKLTIDYIYL